MEFYEIRERIEQDINLFGDSILNELDTFNVDELEIIGKDIVSNYNKYLKKIDEISKVKLEKARYNNYDIEDSLVKWGIAFSIETSKFNLDEIKKLYENESVYMINLSDSNSDIISKLKKEASHKTLSRQIYKIIVAINLNNGFTVGLNLLDSVIFDYKHYNQSEISYESGSDTNFEWRYSYAICPICGEELNTGMTYDPKGHSGWKDNKDEQYCKDCCTTQLIYNDETQEHEMYNTIYMMFNMLKRGHYIFEVRDGDNEIMITYFLDMSYPDIVEKYRQKHSTNLIEISPNTQTR